MLTQITQIIKTEKHEISIGGATTFSKADVFVKPDKGLATFFSYKGSDGMMDDGFTEHSGCPVLEGSSTILAIDETVLFSNFQIFIIHLFFNERNLICISQLVTLYFDELSTMSTPLIPSSLIPSSLIPTTPTLIPFSLIPASPSPFLCLCLPR